MNFHVKLSWILFKPVMYRKYLHQKKFRKLPIEEIKKIQWKRLVKLLYEVNKNSKFYQDFLKNINLDPSDIQNYSQFRKLPIINKEILKKNYDKIRINKNINREYKLIYSSGSTGKPFPFLIDEKRETVNTFISYLLNKENVDINNFEKNNELMIKVEPLNKLNGFIERKNKNFIKKMKYYLISETVGIKNKDVTWKNTEKIYSMMKRKNIRSIYGYSSIIFNLARFFKEKGYNIKLKYIILIAEGILEQQRRFISSIFDCPVYMDYSASECMRMGFECPYHEGYHMDLYNYFFEFLNSNNQPCKSGESGKIVVTNLNNYVLPLIRYEIGDEGIFSNELCNCGLNFPLIKELTGRSIDKIKLGHNKYIMQRNFDGLFMSMCNYIIQYQVIVNIQKKDILLKIIPTNKINKEFFDYLQSKLLSMFENKYSLNIRIVDEIEKEKFGKTKVLIIKR